MTRRWFAVHHGLFTEEHGRAMGLAGRAVYVTVLHLANLRGEWNDDETKVEVEFSVREVAAIVGAKRETVRAAILKLAPRYWTILRRGERRRPWRIEVLKAKRTGRRSKPPMAENGQPGMAEIGHSSCPKSGNQLSEIGQLDDAQLSEIGHSDRRKSSGDGRLRGPLDLVGRERARQTRARAREGRSRSSVEWSKARAIMAALDFNDATQQRVRRCGLTDAAVYSLLSDAREAKKGAGWVWSAIKRMQSGDRS